MATLVIHWQPMVTMAPLVKRVPMDYTNVDNGYLMVTMAQIVLQMMPLVPIKTMVEMMPMATMVSMVTTVLILTLTQILTLTIDQSFLPRVMGL